MEKKSCSTRYDEILDASKTPYHAVKISVEKLKEAGFKRLNLNKKIRSQRRQRLLYRIWNCINCF